MWVQYLIIAGKSVLIYIRDIDFLCVPNAPFFSQGYSFMFM